MKASRQCAMEIERQRVGKRVSEIVTDVSTSGLKKERGFGGGGGGGGGGGETSGIQRKNGKTQSRHKSCDIDFAANFPRCRPRHIRDSSCDAAITSLTGIKIQLYIKLSYIAPYLYLSRWYFLRSPPAPISLLHYVLHGFTTPFRYSPLLSAIFVLFRLLHDHSVSHIRIYRKIYSMWRCVVGLCVSSVWYVCSWEKWFRGICCTKIFSKFWFELDESVWSGSLIWNCCY